MNLTRLFDATPFEQRLDRLQETLMVLGNLPTQASSFFQTNSELFSSLVRNRQREATPGILQWITEELTQ